MNYNGSVYVIDRNGWAKTFPITKALTMIGSAGFNDIVLPDEYGSGVASAHLQLISTQTDRRNFKMVNLVNEPLALSLAGARGNVVVPAKGSRNLEDGDSLKLGDFQLTFYLQSANGISLEKRSENIGVTFEMPSLDLKEGRKLTGLITLKNFGQEKRSQFEMDLEGLPSDCYQIDPAPLLYPGGEEKLQIRFFHLGVRPPAGYCPIKIRVLAVNAYPTEEVIIPVVLNVEPIFRFTVDVDSDAQDQLEMVPEPNETPGIGKEVKKELLQPITFSPTLEEESPKEIPYQPSTEGQPINNNQDEKIEVLEEKKETLEEVDWWAENEPITAEVHNDPIAEFKRGKPKLAVPKSKVQVLKVTTDEPMENEDE